MANPVRDRHEHHEQDQRGAHLPTQVVGNSGQDKAGADMPSSDGQNERVKCEVQQCSEGAQVACQLVIHPSQRLSTVTVTVPS